MPPLQGWRITMLVLPTSVLVLALAGHASAKSLKHKVSNVKAANDRYASSQRLKALADLAAAADPAPATEQLDVAAASINAAAATSFQIYTSDALPDPTPSSACANALTASIACNDTILQMA